MKKMEKFQLSKAEFITGEIKVGKSLLLTLGLKRLFLRSLPLKFVVAIVAPLLFARTLRLSEGKRMAEGRRRIVKFLEKIAPINMRNALPSRYASSLIIGFNHTSMGDILRAALAVLKRYPAKAIYFPANTVFYEAMAPALKYLEQFSIYVYPLITPKIIEETKTTHCDEELLNQVKKRLERAYLAGAEECCRSYGVLMVAPSATRQVTVFRNADEYFGKANTELLPTMTLLLKYVKRTCKTFFVALAINPPNWRKGLNLFKSYDLSMACDFDVDGAEKLDRATKRGFEYAFLRAIANELPCERRYPNCTEDDKPAV